MLHAVVVSLVAIGALLLAVPRELVPSEDRGRLDVQIQAPEGAGYDYTLVVYGSLSGTPAAALLVDDNRISETSTSYAKVRLVHTVTDLSSSPEQEPPEPVRALVTARAQARANGDWGLSDRLRLEIAAAGWQVRDTPQGPHVVRD